MFVLDTNVVSELRKIPQGRCDARVQAWSEQVRASTLFLSAITILELEQGVLLRERRDPGQGQHLRRWLDARVMPAFTGRILPFDETVARRCARLHVPDRQGERDAMIAATALVHGMSVVTRNTTDFQPTGVAVVNPWDAA